jgi:hypothetical protein
MESATEKQKRLIQAEIAKLSGKLETVLATRINSLPSQVRYPDMEDHHDHPHTPLTNDRIHMLLGARHQEVEVVEEEEEDHTRWIYDKASPPPYHLQLLSLR